MLAIAIERHGPIETPFTCPPPPGLQRRAFAVVASLPQRRRPGRMRVCNGLIRRTVIDYKYGKEKSARGGYHRTDRRFFIEAGNYRSTLRRPIHPERLEQPQLRPSRNATRFSFAHWPLGL